MWLSKSIYKIIVLLSIVLYTTACQEEKSQSYQKLCIDKDTSIKNDIADNGILWSLSDANLKHILSLVTEESDRNIYIMNSITTCDMTFKDIELNNNICEVTLNAGAYGYAICSDGSNYSFGCYESECIQYFPFPYQEQS
ncbi:hypothetical protein [Psychrobacter sp. DAB_AL62B]|uniref:hypothetical protein n=1 Tax=Psychrobacter sp. DAB_AL62B TaxID=1028420 RepID=UPI0023817BDF|nr:hypothetical protein [Psychrobacter sp. DAB_AL62B]MDE4455949.1 hypothetical protein [Psychrobacter sp. DAB_AL62B]